MNTVDPTILREAGTALAAESRRFSEYGWMRGTSGNLSVVVNRDPLLLAVTSSGVEKSLLTDQDVVVIDAEGKAADPSDPRPPSAEAGLHSHIAARTGANVVFHVHALEAVVAGHRWPNGIEFSDMEMLKGLGHSAHGTAIRIPVIENHQDMKIEGEYFDAEYLSATDQTPEVPAMIIANHGIHAWGKDVAAARRHLEITEWLLRFAVATR
ncbi:MAG: methylthioribulose 1-phosphate dehydratase [Leucobacter sp.]